MGQAFQANAAKMAEVAVASPQPRMVTLPVTHARRGL